MSTVHHYDCEKYSVLDIKRFVEEHGYEGEIKEDERDKYRHYKLFVKGTTIEIDVPFWSGLGIILASMRMSTYPPGEDVRRSRKLYALLKKKFGIERTGSAAEFFAYMKKLKIKDADKLVIKDFREKG